MVRVGISVEGLTEEIFVKSVLATYLADKGISITPVSINGNVSIDRVRTELQKIANSFDYVTTLYDFYGFKNKLDGDDKDSLEGRLRDSVVGGVKAKLIPYIQMHEFESLLFSCPESMGLSLKQGNVTMWCQQVLNEFDCDPEKINDSIETAPSKRLKQNTPYRKTTHGPKIAKEIGIEKMRQMCSGFNDWLTELEGLKGKRVFW